METTASIASEARELGSPTWVLGDKPGMAVSDVILFMLNYKRYVLIWADSVWWSGSRGPNGKMLIIFIAY